ncbi:MAG: sigma-70 family RNA polymerase sigma factor [Actinobacteria bacterium]|nr:sigma-70 family RNA polymerase sigma factor [Actinomycetota bacterium]
MVRLYLGEIGRHELLDRAEEVALGRAIAAGREALATLSAGTRLTPARQQELERDARAGIEARDRFVRGNLRLVVSIATRHRPSGLPLEDLIQEGNLGLIKAVERFDHQRGFKFSTYAAWWIRQTMSRAATDTGRSVRLPAHVCDQLSGLRAAVADFEARHGRSPSSVELGGHRRPGDRPGRPAPAVGRQPSLVVGARGRGRRGRAGGPHRGRQ